MTAFHRTTATILEYVLDEQRRDLKLFQHRLERADAGASASAIEAFRRQIAELTAVVADLTELLRLIAQANADSAEQDRQEREHDAAEALRIELHLDGPTEDLLAELAVRCGASQAVRF